MNKRLLITVTSTMLSMTAAMPNMTLLAKESLYANAAAENEIIQITSADQFIDMYCSVQVLQNDPQTGQPIIDPATQKQQTIPQLIIHADQTNYKIILYGAALFQTLPADLQEQIRTVYADRIGEQKKAAPSDPARPAITISTYDELVACADQEKKVAEAEAAKKQETVNQDPAGNAAGDNTDTGNSGAGTEAGQPVPGTDVPDNNVPAASDPMPEAGNDGSQNGPIQPEQGTEPADDPENTDPDAENGPSDPAPVLEEAKTADLFIMQVSEGLDPQKQTVQPQLSPSGTENIQEAGQPQAPAPSLIERLMTDPVPEADPVENIREENKSALPAQQASVPAVQQPEQTTTLSEGADTFIRTFASDNGMIYKSATGNNYSKIISGLSAWNRLSKADKDAVNAALEQQGGKSYQKLLQEAQSIQFGSGTITPRVRTAQATHTGFYGVLCAGALALSVLLLSKRKEF